MKYKELVDDIQIQFKSHNESIETQNPYWIMFRFITELTSIRDELLQKIPDAGSVPEWMTLTSDPITPTVGNSGGLSTMSDNLKFSIYGLPDYYPLFNSNSILSVISQMKQVNIYLDDVKAVMLRIRADDESLTDYAYGFIETTKMYIYPAIGKVKVRYIPRVFGEAYASVTEDTVINAPDFIVKEARTRVIDSVILQKQMPDDDFANQQDDGGLGGSPRQTRQ